MAKQGSAVEHAQQQQDGQWQQAQQQRQPAPRQAGPWTEQVSAAIDRQSRPPSAAQPAAQPAAQSAVQRVVFVGAESTGKSTLADYLARAYDSVSVPEIGRFIWEQKQGKLDAGDYVDIALKHRQAEDEAMRLAKRWLFVDTNALTTLLLGLQFGQVTAPVPAELLRCADECATRYAHTFVCADDIPYEEQAVRENEAWRARIQRLVLQDLQERAIPYTILHGSVEQRAAQAMRVLDAQPPAR